MDVLVNPKKEFEFEVPVVIVGAGACGLCAALAAKESGANVLVLEQDPTPLGTTAMSTGLIPGAGTRLQSAAGIEDSAELFAADIMKKTRNQTDANIALQLAKESAKTIEWLIDNHNIPLSLVDSFLYPGHSVMRMHGSPNRTGSELMGTLCNAVEKAGIDILTNALVTDLLSDDENRVLGVRIQRPDGEVEEFGCKSLILGCCGFAGNNEMVEQFIPEIVEAEFFGHPGNKGDAIKWGQMLGADVADISSYQGHGGLAVGHGVPILWPMIMEGAFQVNQLGKRFSDESLGYSEQAVEVLKQPDHIAWNIYDQKLHELMMEFEDYNNAMDVKAIKKAANIDELAEITGIDIQSLATTISEVEKLAKGIEKDTFGRSFEGKPPLTPPYYTVKVTGALFHTQGGLVVDKNARVLTEKGNPLPNLFAGGGAARGISGPSNWGYIAGNGLLTATTFGRLAGSTAAAMVT